MKILLDEMMPRQFAVCLPDHEVRHVVDLGWRHVANGKLLDLGEADGYEVFVTKDGNLPFQQNVAGRRIAIIVLRPTTQGIQDLLALAPKVVHLLSDLRAGSVITVPAI